MRSYRTYRKKNYHNSRIDSTEFAVFSLLVVGFVAFLYTYKSQIETFLKSLVMYGILIISIFFIFYLIKIIRRQSGGGVVSTNSNILKNYLEKSENFTSSTFIPEESRYKLNNGLVTPTEEKFMKVLEEVVGDRYRIVPQVQLSRIMKPVDSNKNFTNYKDFNLIKAKSIDFVLYDKDLKPHLAIELDDRSHRRYDRIKRDEFVNKVMEEVGLRIIHIPVSYNYDSEWLKMEIFK